MPRRTVTSSILFATAALPLVVGAAALAGGSAPADGTAVAARVARGEYLVAAGVCNDCHTPHVMGPKGPEPDKARTLSGHPSDAVLTPPPKLTGSWGLAGANSNTAYAGAWGISFTANLTPDEETGLGKWTEDMFIRTLRTGRHEGKGRPILPPMPYAWFAKLTDDDLKAVFAYLRSLPPVKNRVPSPVDPLDGEAQ